jgi:hypothetical protein
MKTSPKRSKRRAWSILVAVAVVLVVITFTPLILNPGKIYPKLLSMPFSLWTSMLITIILVLLTYLASKVQDKD